MKQWALAALVPILRQKKGIKRISRIGDVLLELLFDDNTLFGIDLTRSESLMAPLEHPQAVARRYNAPFDTVLAKRFFGTTLTLVNVPEGERVLEFTCTKTGGYKAESTLLRLEFTGRHTNAIICDETGKVMEALRHISSLVSTRPVKVGLPLSPLPPSSFSPVSAPPDCDVCLFLANEWKIKYATKLSRLKEQRLLSLAKRAETVRGHLNALTSPEMLLEESQHDHNDAILLNAYLGTLPNFAESVKLEDFTGEEKIITIPAGVTLTRHAQNLFKRSKKAKQKALGLAQQKENLHSRLLFIEAITQAIHEAHEEGEVERLVPLVLVKEKKGEQNEAIAVTEIDGYKVWVGKNAKGNAELLKRARASDMWFHLQGKPSAHVLVRTEKKNIPHSLIIEAGKLCIAVSTTYKGRYLVDYTPRRNLHVQSGADVVYNTYSTIALLKE